MPQSILLDGDELRAVLQDLQCGYDVASRKKLAFSYAKMCHLLARQGHTVIIATISLFADLHEWNRENLPGYLEVFLDVPEDIRVSRDPKGLYASAKNGKNSHMAGVGTPVDFPNAPDVILDVASTVEESVKTVLQSIGMRES